MQVTVRGKHVRVPEQIEERARTKLAKLQHYLPLLEDAAVEVDLTHQKAKEPAQRYLVRVTVSGRGVHLQAEERAADPESAVDLAARVLSRQASRHKQRLYGRNRKAKPATKARPAAKRAKAPADSLVNVKHFAMKPMTVEEAMDEMEVLGHDFFIFHDADDERVALLYRRRAGGYGLIVPELS